MRDNRTFQDGYAEGYAAIMGGSVAVPFCSEYVPTNGRTPFQEGIKWGVEDALRQQGRLSN